VNAFYFATNKFNSKLALRPRYFQNTWPLFQSQERATNISVLICVQQLVNFISARGNHGCDRAAEGGNGYARHRKGSHREEIQSPTAAASFRVNFLKYFKYFNFFSLTTFLGVNEALFVHTSTITSARGCSLLLCVSLPKFVLV
jgi:hypothetical protein